jgi:hypothetical protein
MLIEELLVLISWKWGNSGTSKLTTKAFTPSHLDQSSGHDTGGAVAVPHVESNTAYHPLGVQMSPIGSTVGSYQCL